MSPGPTRAAVAHRFTVEHAMLAPAATCLDNGLKVVITPLPHLHSATISLAIGCGSRHETPQSWGLAHLLEHMLFRGSAQYPDAQALALAFEQAGGTLEAETWRDHTYLSVTAHPSRLPDVLQALADMVIAPRFLDLDVERQIVATELQAELDERGRDIDLGNLSRAHVWADHPMGRRIIGSRKSVLQFDVADLQRQHRTYYGAHNSVLAIAGPVDPEAMRQLVARCFDRMAPGRAAPLCSPALFAPRGKIGVRRAAGSQIALQLTFDALPDCHPDFFAQTLLVDILDDGMRSRLQQALCEKRGLVYTLNTGLDCYSDCGLYDIEMVVAPRRAATAVVATLDTLAAVRDAGVRDDELTLARERSLHAIEFRNDSPAELAQHLAVSTLFGAPTQPKEQMRRLHAVTCAAIHRVAQHLFAGKPPYITLMGPTHRTNLARIEKCLAAFSR